MSNTSTPGPSLRVLRETAGMTQIEVAALAGSSASYLSLVETGKKIPSLALVAKVAAVIAQRLKDPAKVPA